MRIFRSRTPPWVYPRRTLADCWIPIATIGVLLAWAVFILLPIWV